jgi:hypothetical protein
MQMAGIAQGRGLIPNTLAAWQCWLLCQGTGRLSAQLMIVDVQLHRKLLMALPHAHGVDVTLTG